MAHRLTLTAMAVAVALLVSGCAARPEPRIGAGHVCVPVMTYPAAGQEIEIGLKFCIGAEPLIPEAYTVTDRGFILLDTGRRRAVEFRDGAPVRALFLPGVVEGRSVAAGTGNDLYVYDHFNQAVSRVSWSGHSIAEYSLPDKFLAPPLLRSDGRGAMCLVSGHREYGLEAGRWSDGLTFPGARGRHSVDYVTDSRADVVVDGRTRWTLEAGELKDVRLIGYDRDRRLIATAVDLELWPRKLLLFILYRDGTVGKSVINMELDAYPEHSLSIGGDGRLYLLGFRADEMVLYEVRQR